MADNSLSLLFLNHADVAELLDIPLTLSAVRDAFIAEAQGQVNLGPAAPMPVTEQGWLMAMPAVLQSEDVAGVKWLGYYQREQNDITPSSWGNLLVLNNTTDGLPFALLDCTDITALRTAGGHAVVAAQALARQDARKLSVLGTGSQAEAGIRAFDAAFLLERITVYSRSKINRARLVARLAPSLRSTLVAAETPEQLAYEADILLTCSGAIQPVIQAEWLAPGITVVAVSAFRDLDPRFSNLADAWYLGNKTSDWKHIVELPEFAPHVDATRVDGTLGEILLGRIPGRTSQEQRILFTHMGMGALDVAVGNRVYQKARATGKGQTLHLA
jgi:ornithine cyclodeaminase/alanine dehydrogenase-like protein (mu-crystallin family)